ncbi:ATP-binding protein [Nocardia abscessus]|uniref:ATP-binding protein n=1 Tax=Nocardia abscessus TaxID=120957 RepID=UPI0024541DEB|nr:LuxR C-terminal-related transcriptional regulator [Nocardia abscessus]
MTDNDPLRTRREAVAPVTAELAAAGFEDAVGIGRGGSTLPLELTSFIDRRTELAEVKNLLASSRLVTLTGIGGIGKTRLALRAASGARHDFADGVWLVELAESDGALLVEVVAARLGVRDESAGALREVLIDFLKSREALLVLDNCEHVVAAVAELTEALLRSCPGVRVLATSREPLNIAGEAVLRMVPLTVPDPDREPTLLGLPRFDAVTLFADRAATAVPGFEVDEDNKAAVARICARLEGLPLAIELAAARMRMMSPQQISQRLTDRYALLTRGSRTAPSRQQTLRWCIDWSYELCTTAERRLWARLSIFAGSCELDAAERVCGADLAPDGPLDVLSSLVDKSVLLREVSGAVVRFRMLETVRDYGRQKLRESGEDQQMRRHHRDWYRQLTSDAEAGWISDRQLDWIARLDREQPNLREALEACLSEETEEATEAGLCIATALFEFWSLRGLFGEARYWLDRFLARPDAGSITGRVSALRVYCQSAASQGDFQSAAALLSEAQMLAEQSSTLAIHAQIAYMAGILALVNGEGDDACAFFELAVEMLGSDRTSALYIAALTYLGWAYELRGDTIRAVEHYRLALSITEACGELLYRSGALRGLGVAAWQQGEPDRAHQLLEEALRVNRGPNSPGVTAFSLEALAWTVADHGEAERAAVLMGAAQGLWPAGSSGKAVFTNMSRFHEDCERMTRRALGTRAFAAAFRQGEAMDTEAAVSYALGEQPTETVSATGPSTRLTKRERQVADLVAQGLSNKQIAARLVISQRTAQGHVEHILTKLGFTSRAQIAAWIVEEAGQDSSRPPAARK